MAIAIQKRFPTGKVVGYSVAVTITVILILAVSVWGPAWVRGGYEYSDELYFRLVADGFYVQRVSGIDLDERQDYPTYSTFVASAKRQGIDVINFYSWHWGYHVVLFFFDEKGVAHVLRILHDMKNAQL